LDKTKRQSAILGLILLALIIIGDIVSGAIGVGTPAAQAQAHDTAPLGTWLNMPTGTACGVGNTSASMCELMGNQSYRGLLTVDTPIASSIIAISVGLTVNCIIPSNTVGAQLQLQYANYTLGTHINSSNFVNIATSIFIDASVNNPCPGFLEAPSGSLPFSNAGRGAFLLRVVGIGGGGIGDNPRFSSVSVYANENAQRIFYGRPVAITTSGFTAQAVTTFAVTVTTTVTFQWIATSNGVLVESSSGSCSISAGLNGCTSPVTFGTIFGASPNVVVDPSSNGSAVTLFAGSINLLSAQTLTV